MVTVSRTKELLKDAGTFLTEMLSTFLFTFMAGLTYEESIVVVASAIGMGCGVLVAAWDVHLNPIISIAFIFCDSKAEVFNLLIRIIAQLLGAIFGGLISVGALRAEPVCFAERLPADSEERALAMEIIFSIILVLVVMRTHRNATSALSHGFGYAVAILSGFGLFCGNAIINPFTALGLMLGSTAYSSSDTKETDIWIHMVGPLIGCIIAVLIYQFTEFFSEEEDSSAEETSTWPSDQYQKNRPTELRSGQPQIRSAQRLPRTHYGQV